MKTDLPEDLTGMRKSPRRGELSHTDKSPTATSKSNSTSQSGMLVLETDYQFWLTGSIFALGIGFPIEPVPKANKIIILLMGSV